MRPQSSKPKDVVFSDNATVTSSTAGDLISKFAVVCQSLGSQLICFCAEADSDQHKQDIESASTNIDTYIAVCSESSKSASGPGLGVRLIPMKLVCKEGGENGTDFAQTLPCALNQGGPSRGGVESVDPRV
jgi:hypothetical protein